MTASIQTARLYFDHASINPSSIDARLMLNGRIRRSSACSKWWWCIILGSGRRRIGATSTILQLSFLWTSSSPVLLSKSLSTTNFVTFRQVRLVLWQVNILMTTGHDTLPNCPSKLYIFLFRCFPFALFLSSPSIHFSR